MLTIKTRKRRQWSHFGVCIVNFNIFLSFYSTSIVAFEEVFLLFARDINNKNANGREHLAELGKYSVFLNK